jgi:hypothetical protein
MASYDDFYILPIVAFCIWAKDYESKNRKIALLIAKFSSLLFALLLIYWHGFHLLKKLTFQMIGIAMKKLQITIVKEINFGEVVFFEVFCVVLLLSSTSILLAALFETSRILYLIIFPLIFLVMVFIKIYQVLDRKAIITSLTVLFINLIGHIIMCFNLFKDFVCNIIALLFVCSICVLFDCLLDYDILFYIKYYPGTGTNITN